ncbi:hypothetical protein AUJ17_03530 [Candidatus Micrarchaeota archaeon CG1_02_47_40]|nr:MAG: hypothetical protein AUJ17_03530 [Candidatus Micrarchaeota archaeon CG1_02_47_40]
MVISDLPGSYRSEIDKEIRKLIPRNKNPWEVYGIIWDFLERGGKRFRPALCLLCAESVRGKREDALPAATCIELFHNFTLIHDDIEDDSKMRRGKPCLHIMHGLPLAINAGDGLFMMSWKAILESRLPVRKQLEVQERLHRTFTAVLEGQAVELRWLREKRWNITEENYLEMARGKTGALIAGSCEVGGLAGGASAAQAKMLYEFGMAVGLAFQVQDDILNLVGKEEEYKKEIGGDITEGKRTLMVLHTLKKAAPEEKQYIIKTLDSHTGRQEEIGKVVAIMEKYGSIAYAKRIAKKMVVDAKRGVMALPATQARERLLALADFLIERKV